MCEYIGTQGWTIPWTNLNLYGALVRSNLLFGAPAWAPKHLLANHGASDPQLRTLEVFHRHCITPNLPPIGAIVRWLHQLSLPDPYTVFVGIKVSHSMPSEKDFYTNLFG